MKLYSKIIGDKLFSIDLTKKITELGIKKFDNYDVKEYKHNLINGLDQMVTSIILKHLRTILILLKLSIKT